MKIAPESTCVLHYLYSNAFQEPQRFLHIFSLRIAGVSSAARSKQPTPYSITMLPDTTTKEHNLIPVKSPPHCHSSTVILPDSTKANNRLHTSTMNQSIAAPPSCQIDEKETTESIQAPPSPAPSTKN